MYSSSLLVLALAVFGASAQTLVSSGCNGGLLGGVSGINGGLLGGVSGINNGFLGGVSGINGGLLGGVSGINGGIVSGVSGINGGLVSGGVSTPVLENLPVRLPSLVQPTSVQESCNCIKTVVRPQLRKEVFTIPSVQRFFQTTSTPVVETVPYVSGSSVDVPSVATGVETGLVGTGFNGLNSGIVSGGIVSGVNSGFGLNGGFNGGFNGGLNGGLIGGVSGINGVVSGINSGFGTC